MIQQHDDRNQPAGQAPSYDATGPESSTAPAVRQPRWSGKKTAVTAALAISLASAGSIAAAAALPQGSDGGGMGGPPGSNRGGGNQQPPWMQNQQVPPGAGQQGQQAPPGAG